MNGEESEIDRPDRPESAEFRQPRERVIDEIDRQKRNAEADRDKHRTPVPFPVADADAAIGVEEHDDRRRVDEGEHMRQIVNGNHGGVNPNLTIFSAMAR